MRRNGESEERGTEREGEGERKRGAVNEAVNVHKDRDNAALFLFSRIKATGEDGDDEQSDRLIPITRTSD